MNTATSRNRLGGALLAATVVLTVSLVSDDADDAARAPIPAAREAPPAGPIPIWPSSRRAYTVVAFTTSDRKLAERRARALLARRENAGVFRTNGYDFFEPCLWVTWVGVYRSRPAAQGVAPRVTRTIPGAYVTLVRKSA